MVSTMAARSRAHSSSCAAASRAKVAMDSTSGSKIFMTMRSATGKRANTAFAAGGLADDKLTVWAATVQAPALALWFASREAPTRACAQGWQPAEAD